jgi:hypothetical protein
LPDQKFLPGELRIDQKVVHAFECHEPSVVKKSKGFDDFIRLPSMLAENQIGSFLERIMELGKAFRMYPSEAPSAESEGWNAGLCIDPHGFSDQLGKLQNSLNQPSLNQSEKHARPAAG